MRQELIDEIGATVPTMEGWATVEKATAMCQLIEVERPRTVVEIGVFGGRSLVPQAMMLRENGVGRIYGIDPWEIGPVLEGNPSDADKEWWSKNVDLHTIHKGCMEAIWAKELDDWSVILRCTSRAACSLFPMIDILHIDGNHTEFASCRDVEDYLPRVKKNGHIWFDDCDWETTQKAIVLLDNGCTRIKQVGNCVLFKKYKSIRQRTRETIESAIPKEVSEAVQQTINAI